eukprot:3107120-Pleurochrysis_carterae.AAC.1
MQSRLTRCLGAVRHLHDGRNSGPLHAVSSKLLDREIFVRWLFYVGVKFVLVITYKLESGDWRVHSKVQGIIDNRLEWYF